MGQRAGSREHGAGSMGGKSGKDRCRMSGVGGLICAAIKSLTPIPSPGPTG